MIVNVVDNSDSPVLITLWITPREGRGGQNWMIDQEIINPLIGCGIFLESGYLGR